MALPKKTLPLPVPSSSAEIELPLSSTWRQADGRRPTPQTSAAQPQSVVMPAAPAPETPDKSAAPKLFTPVAAEPKPAPPAETAPPMAKAKENAHIVFGQSTCPKCGQLQAPAKACARCGLLFANWRPGMEAKLFADVPPATLAKLQELWGLFKQAEPEGREEALKQFHQFAAGNKATLVSGDFYRRHLAQHPEDTLVAKWRERLVFETQLLLPQRQEKSGKHGVSRRALLIGIAVALVLTLLSAYLFSNLLKR